MNEQDFQWMQLAIEQAALAGRADEVPVGAVVVFEEEVIGRGFNRPISGHDPSAHAEIQALRAAAKHHKNYRLVGADLFVTLEPCLMCVGAMVHARIERCVFGASDPKSGAAISLFQGFDLPYLNHHVKAEGGVMAEECGQVLRQFFRKRR